jgi:hypothetical protein
VRLQLSGPFARSITRSHPFRMLRAHPRKQGPSARLQITSHQAPYSWAFLVVADALSNGLGIDYTVLGVALS